VKDIYGADAEAAGKKNSINQGRFSLPLLKEHLKIFTSERNIIIRIIKRIY